MSTIQFVPLANTKCNSCGHLVSHAKTFHDGCHFTKGNDSCPAKTFQIGVGVNVEKASQAIAEALFNKDVVALQRHVNKLASYKPVQTEQVLEAVFNKYALLNGIEVEDQVVALGDDDEGDDEDDEGLQDGDEDDIEGTGDEEGDDADDADDEGEDDATDVAASTPVVAAPVAAAPAAAADEDDEWNDDATPGG